MQINICGIGTVFFSVKYEIKTNNLLYEIKFMKGITDRDIYYIDDNISTNMFSISDSYT